MSTGTKKLNFSVTDPTRPTDDKQNVLTRSGQLVLTPKDEFSIYSIINIIHVVKFILYSII